ncbi:M28 family peptidase [bacterium]|nr:M28 family peptidase [bacterium]
MHFYLLVFLTFLPMLASCAKPPFDGDSAMRYLEKQCSFGPRNPNSEGHKQCLQFLTEELRKYCDRVDHQNFVYIDKKDTSVKLHGTNIIASINLQPKTKKRVLLSAHWDTRPWADKDPDSTNRDKPILGANDGASGVAVLLEIAKIIKENPLDIGVDIILWDLEDYGEHNGELYPDSLNPYCIGSDYFAKNNKTYWPAYGILLDMVGDKNLDIPIEKNSYNQAKDVVNKVWDKAKKLEKPAFRTSIEADVFDDHIPLLRIGIPCINIIDFNYPDASNRYHHTLSDTPDKCSAESLQQIGDVLVEVLYSE